MIGGGLELNDEENAEVRMTFGTLKILGCAPGIPINVGRCLTIGSRKMDIFYCKSSASAA